jgi:hypothetical protein
MTWARASVAAALVDMINAATAGSCYVHAAPPATLNAPSVVIMRPNVVTYSVAAFGVDDVELPVAIVGAADQDVAVDTLKNVVRAAVLGDSTLKGTVYSAVPSEERNWRQLTGAGGIQLLYVELVLKITQ